MTSTDAIERLCRTFQSTTGLNAPQNTLPEKSDKAILTSVEIL